MKKSELILCFIILFTAGCKFHQYQRKLVEINQHSVENVSRFALYDLNGDSRDEIILLQEPETGIGEITIRDDNFQIFSQLNNKAEINQISYYDLDSDGDQDIFVSGVRETGEIFLYRVNYEWKKELLRSDKPLFEVQSRNNLPAGVRCYSSFGMKGMADIDDDGALDLFVLGSAGFSCYPRGLWVIDAKTSIEKWHYEFASNYRSLHYTDIDGDGEKEFIITTQALKNHQNVVNQMDDNHSYLLIIDKNGKTLLREEMVRGYSLIDCFLEDVDEDGEPEIITVKTTWGNQHERNGISAYKWENGRLILVKEKQIEIPFTRNSRVICEDIDNDGKREILLVTDEHELLMFNNQLEIIRRYSETGLAKICRVADLDGDGEQEVLGVSIDGNLVILDKYLNCKLVYEERDVSSAKIEIYNPGFGEKKQVMIYEAGKFRFYECCNVGFWQMIYWKLFLLVIILLTIIVFVIRYIQLANYREINSYLFDTLTSAVLVVNRKNRILFANRQMEELCGKGKLDNQNLENVGKFAHILRAEYNQYLNSGVTEYQNKLIVPFIEQHLEINICRLKEKAGLYMIKISDRTDMMQMKEKADWAETARGLSHGIRKHLNNILLASEQIAVCEDKRVKTLSPIVMDEINNLKYFVQSFQRFTELKKLHLQLLDTNELIRQYLEAKLTEFPDRIRFTSEIEHDLPWLKIDKIRFAEVLDNLLNNALEAIEEEGKIILKAYRWEENSNVVKFCLEISDTGCGIPAEFLKNIFVPYFTTKASGTGIGLPLVKKMMNEFEGSVEAESKSEVGTTIRLVFPAYTKGKV